MLARSSLALAVAPLFALLTACAPSGIASTPEGASVQFVRGERTVLHGTATIAPTSPKCDAVKATDAGHFVQLGDDTLMTVALHAANDRGRMPGAILHLTHLASQRTWCAAMDSDGLAAEVGGDLPSGVYALHVTEPARVATASYEIVLRKL
jgi:hypothetical protein